MATDGIAAEVQRWRREGDALKARLRERRAALAAELVEVDAALAGIIEAEGPRRRGAPFRGGGVKAMPGGKFRYAFRLNGRSTWGPLVATFEEAEAGRVAAVASFMAAGAGADPAERQPDAPAVRASAAEEAPATAPPPGPPDATFRKDPCTETINAPREDEPPVDLALEEEDQPDDGLAHRWTANGGGTASCGSAGHGGRLTRAPAGVTCSDCIDLGDPVDEAPREPLPPAWIMAWLKPEQRDAFQAIAVDGASCRTQAWLSGVSANVISGRINSARHTIKRLLKWQAERAAEGIPLTEDDKRSPDRGTTDPLLSLLREKETWTEDDRQSEAADGGQDVPAPTLTGARTKLSVINGRFRARTISAPRLTRLERAAGAELEYPPDVQRPLTRGDCSDLPRPCPFVSCAHHLYLDVSDAGAMKLNFPHLEPWDMEESCSLDVADRGGITLEETGAIVNLTRERIRQIEVRGLDEIKNSAAGRDLGMMPERWAE